MTGHETSTPELIQQIKKLFPRINFFGAAALTTPALEIPESMFGTPQMLSAAEDLAQLLRIYRDTFGIGRGLAANQVKDAPLLRMTAMILPTSEDSERMVVACNPRLRNPVGTALFTEVCLSDPEHGYQIVAPWQQTLDYREPSGERRTLELDPSLSRLAEHEVRHLDGITCRQAEYTGVVTLTGGVNEILSLPRIERLT